VRLTAHAGFGGRLHGPAVQPTLPVLRHGAMAEVFDGVRAPSTLGSFLRSFSWGNVRQLEKASGELLAELARRAPLLPGADRLAFVDVDSTQRRVYGHKKQGAAFGHTKIQGKAVLVRGLNALAATISTPDAAPVVAGTRLRGGSANTGRGAASLLAEAIGTAPGGRVHGHNRGADGLRLLCATRRTAALPAQRAKTRGDVLGSNG
jgi:hypothetical protein